MKMNLIRALAVLGALTVAAACQQNGGTTSTPEGRAGRTSGVAPSAGSPGTSTGLGTGGSGDATGGSADAGMGHPSRDAGR